MKTVLIVIVIIVLLVMMGEMSRDFAQRLEKNRVKREMEIERLRELNYRKYVLGEDLDDEDLD